MIDDLLWWMQSEPSASSRVPCIVPNDTTMQSNPTTMYDRYIACLNARDWERLGEFVADGAIHNGRRLGVDGYRAMLQENCRDIPDLRFNPDLVVADEGHIAARIRFDCAPTHEFLGLPVNGRRIVFHEHAFYILAAGKIAEVFSVIDKAAIEAQLRL